MYRKIAVTIALAIAPVAAEAQTRTLTGMVLPGDARTPFAGAEVSVVGGTASVCVDDRGSFTIDVPATAARLRITPVGFAPQEVTVARGQDTVEVALADHVILLDGVEVVGYAAALGHRDPASSAVVNAGAIGAVPASTIESALQGKVVGAQIQRNSGAPGGGFSIQMRGVNTILGSNDPIVIVDGSIVNNATLSNGAGAITGSASEDAVGRIADLNPNDIERIELLRGAAAAAHYGSRASNGVILITTKRGARPAPSPSNTALRCFIPR
jgi:TonB-dependent SusC/RagA subfamily outer membrane receptor